MRIFIGSSTESKVEAGWVAEILDELGEDVVAWWEHFDGGKAGKTVVECIEQAANECGAAVLVAAEEDVLTMRGEKAVVPRDNVLLEYAWFVGRRGRSRAVLATLGDPTLPGDLDGLCTLRLDRPRPAAVRAQRESFKRLNRPKLKQWLQEARRVENYGMEDTLTRGTYRLLRLAGLRAVRAVDVVGPSAWSDPQTYSYVAPQFRKYVDINAQPNNSTMLVSKGLLQAITLAIANFKQAMSSSPDNRSRSVLAGAALLPKEIPEMEMSRILMWTSEELMSPAGECVVAFHEAFHVPLFFLQTDPNSPARSVDYILFETGETTEGYYGYRDQGYATELLERGGIPGLGDPKREYARLLKSKKLLLAADALSMLKADVRSKPADQRSSRHRSGRRS
jgi:hypothetical protein